MELEKESLLENVKLVVEVWTKTLKETSGVFFGRAGGVYLQGLAFGKSIREFYNFLWSPDAEKEVDKHLMENIVKILSSGYIIGMEQKWIFDTAKSALYEKLKLNIKDVIKFAKIEIERYVEQIDKDAWNDNTNWLWVYDLKWWDKAEIYKLLYRLAKLNVNRA